MEEKTVNIFIASSMAGEFKKQRDDLDDAIQGLNKQYKGIKFQWNRPERMTGAMLKEGLQDVYDQKIKESDLFFLIVGKKLGKFTRHEFQIAWRQYFSFDSPRIFTYFLLKGGEMPTEATWNFWRLIQNFGHYPQTFADWEGIKVEISRELGLWASEITPPENPDGTMSGDDIQKRIRENDAEANRLINEGLTWETLPEVQRLYHENDRLMERLNIVSTPQMKEAREKLVMGAYYAQENSFERAEQSYRAALEVYQEATKDNPAYETDVAMIYNHLGALFTKAGFTKEAERQYRRAVEIQRKWVSSDFEKFSPNLAIFYNNLANLLNQSGRPEEAEWYYQAALDLYRELVKTNPSAYELYEAGIYNNLGALFADTGRFEQAEALYRQALEVRRRLAEENPANPYHQNNLAMTCNNLGMLLLDFGGKEKMTEAEALCAQALEIRRRLAEGNPGAYEPAVADTLNNLGCLLSNMKRTEEAERHYREALAIYRRLAENNYDAYAPYVADLCNNLGNLLLSMERPEEAEPLYREALETYRRLAEGNPAAFEPDVAQSCYHLGLFERNRGNRDAAKRYFEKARSLYEKFPRLESYAKNCRDRLAELDEPAPDAPRHGKRRAKNP